MSHAASMLLPLSGKVSPIQAAKQSPGKTSPGFDSGFVSLLHSLQHKTQDPSTVPTKLSSASALENNSLQSAEQFLQFFLDALHTDQEALSPEQTLRALLSFVTASSADGGTDNLQQLISEEPRLTLGDHEVEQIKMKLAELAGSGGGLPVQNQAQSDLIGHLKKMAQALELFISGPNQASGQLGGKRLQSDPQLRQQLQSLVQMLNLSGSATDSDSMPAPGHNEPGMTANGGQGRESIAGSKEAAQELLQKIRALLHRIQGDGSSPQEKKGIDPQTNGGPADRGWVGIHQSQMQSQSTEKLSNTSSQLLQPVANGQQVAQNQGRNVEAGRISEAVRMESLVKAESQSLGGDTQSTGADQDGKSGQGKSTLANLALFQSPAANKGPAHSGPHNFGHSLQVSSEHISGGGTGGSANTGFAQSTALNGYGGEARFSAVSQTMEQSIVDQVRFRLNQGLRSGHQEIVVRMHPRELGEVRLSLVSEDGSLRAHLHVQSQNVQDALERHMPRLRETLAEQGVDVDDFEFSREDQAQEHGNTPFQDKHSPQSQPQESNSGPQHSASAPIPESRFTKGDAQQGVSLRI